MHTHFFHVHELCWCCWTNNAAAWVTAKFEINRSTSHRDSCNCNGIRFIFPFTLGLLSYFNLRDLFWYRQFHIIFIDYRQQTAILWQSYWVTDYSDLSHHNQTNIYAFKKWKASIVSITKYDSAMWHNSANQIKPRLRHNRVLLKQFRHSRFAKVYWKEK